MLVTLKEILKIAEEKKIAVGAFNATNYDTLKAVVSAAEELDLPVIVQFAQVHRIYIDIEDVGPMMLKAAKEAKVPVCVHLDHGENLEYISKALELGFTGVMIDGSTLPYEENVNLCSRVVELAHRAGASVEAELGCMGRTELEKGENTGADDDTKIYTDPDMAKNFVEATGIDALACSFGTTHGLYIAEPKLDFGIVEAVRANTGKIPVVMHGGSGVSDENFRKAVEAGVRKINYFTYMDKAAGAALKSYVDTQLANGKTVFYMDATMKARQAMKDNVMAAMKVFAGI